GAASSTSCWPHEDRNRRAVSRALHDRRRRKAVLGIVALHQRRHVAPGGHREAAMPGSGLLEPRSELRPILATATGWIRLHRFSEVPGMDDLPSTPLRLHVA